MSEINSVRFEVLGVAQPKGSTRAFVPKGWTRPIITSANKGLKAWEAAIRTAAQQHAAGIFFDGAVSVRIEFHLPRPKTLSKKIMWHTKRPDLDKCVRALDGLTGLLWKDDAQIVEIVANKQYADHQPRAIITVTAC